MKKQYFIILLSLSLVNIAYAQMEASPELYVRNFVEEEIDLIYFFDTIGHKLHFYDSVVTSIYSTLSEVNYFQVENDSLEILLNQIWPDVCFLIAMQRDWKDHLVSHIDSFNLDLFQSTVYRLHRLGPSVDQLAALCEYYQLEDTAIERKQRSIKLMNRSNLLYIEVLKNLMFIFSKLDY